MSDGTKAAPSLSDELQATFEYGDYFKIGMVVVKNFDTILAALRAVEAVRAFSERDSYKTAGACGCRDCEGWLEGVEAVQALLESKR